MAADLVLASSVCAQGFADARFALHLLHLYNRFAYIETPRSCRPGGRLTQHFPNTPALMIRSEQRLIGGTALAIDTLGFGCAPLGNLHHIADEDAAVLLGEAWREGFRYFDTAPHYGQGLSERRLGMPAI